MSEQSMRTGRYEVLAWYWMRISGLLLVFLALFHLWLNHVMTDVGELEYSLVIDRLTKWPILRIMDFLLLTLGLSHGVNGLKHVIDDHVHDRQKRLFWLTGLLVVFSIFWVAGTAVLFTLEVGA